MNNKTYYAHKYHLLLKENLSWIRAHFTSTVTGKECFFVHNKTGERYDLNKDPYTKKLTEYANKAS